MWWHATKSITQAYRKLYAVTKPCQRQNWIWDTTNISHRMNCSSSDLRFSQKWLWILQSSEVWHHAVWEIFTSVSEQQGRMPNQTEHSESFCILTPHLKIFCKIWYLVTDILADYTQITSFWMWHHTVSYKFISASEVPAASSQFAKT
jgi:hypothetical protein